MANIPSSLRVPGTYVTVDNTKAIEGALVAPSQSVIFGQMTSDGTAASADFVQVFSKEDADTKFGRGSMLAEMFEYWFQGNLASEVYAVALPDATGATAMEKTITVTGDATEAGTVSLYINGDLLSVGVTSGDTYVEVGAAIETAIGTATTDADYPVTAGAVDGVVTLTAKNGGTVGNQIAIEQNLISSDVTPAGLTVVIADSVSGATDIDVDDAIAALPDDLVNWIVTPYNDSTNLGKVTDELDRRWTVLVQLDGHAITAYGGDAATVVAWGDTLNNQHLTVIDSGKASSTPEYLWAASVTAPIAYESDTDVARPFRSLTIPGVYGDTASNKRKLNERNSLINAGISTHLIAVDGNVVIERMVTTYKENPVGAPDASYGNLNTLTTTSFLRQSMINMIGTKFPRHKLSDDTATIPPGQPVVTPLVMTGAIYDLYTQWQSIFITTNEAFFKETLVVARDATDRSRLNIYMRPSYVGQFYISDVTMAFKL